jgi:predicted nuclease with TOPRIM domain
MEKANQGIRGVGSSRLVLPASIPPEILYNHGDQNDVSEKDSIRASFLELQRRLQQSVELFHSLKQDNVQLRERIVRLEAEVNDLSEATAEIQHQVAKLLDERKLVRDKVQRILENISLPESRKL